MSEAILLTPANVAEQLEANELSILRLIGRGRLRATSVSGKWLLTPADLQNYVQRGAEDFRDLRGKPDVLDDNSMSFKAEELEKAVFRAAEDQKLSDENAEVRARRQSTAAGKPQVSRPGLAHEELLVQLRLTASILAVLDGPIASAFKIPGTSYPFEKFGDLFLGEKLREQINRQHRDAAKKPNTPAPLEWLYGSPEHYKAVVQEALRQVAAGAITGDERKRFPDRGEGDISVHVTYSLANSLWATSARLQGVAELLL
jgi:hypothetical protein